MSVEIPNRVHAMAVLNLANVPADQILVKGAGVRAAARSAQGVYTVTLEEPLDVLGGIVEVFHAAATSRVVVAQIQALSGHPNGDNIQINGFTDAGAASDTGEAYLMVHRFPTVD
ncbi:MAG TPA: hypothetical protein VJN18_11075 [Polyangiaceae bacterium]|nr:hypothetical protein [Polyangiaceae bacterium]